MDMDKIASALFNSKRLETKNAQTTTTLTGKAVSNSENGYVDVIIQNANVNKAELSDLQDTTAVKIPTSPAVREGDTVEITAIGAGTKTMLVTSVVGSGDRISAQAQSAKSEAEKAKEISDMVNTDLNAFKENHQLTDEDITKTIEDSATETKTTIEGTLNSELANYATKTETTQAVDTLKNTVSETYETKKNAANKYSEIEQNANSISSTVSANYSTLDGKIANLGTEITQTESDLTVKINAATSTANTAKSTADKAQTTANTANTNATSAKNTATAAQSTANTASTNATNAQNTANSVQGIAQRAEDSANEAQEIAQTAYTRANNAEKVATNYLNFNSEGLVVGNMQDTTLGSNVLIASNAVQIRDGETVYANFDNDSLDFYADNKEIATFKTMQFNGKTTSSVQSDGTLFIGVRNGSSLFFGLLDDLGQVDDSSSFGLVEDGNGSIYFAFHTESIQDGIGAEFSRYKTLWSGETVNNINFDISINTFGGFEVLEIFFKYGHSGQTGVNFPYMGSIRVDLKQLPCHAVLQGAYDATSASIMQYLQETIYITSTGITRSNAHFINGSYTNNQVSTGSNSGTAFYITKILGWE